VNVAVGVEVKVAVGGNVAVGVEVRSLWCCARRGCECSSWRRCKVEVEVSDVGVAVHLGWLSLSAFCKVAVGLNSCRSRGRSWCCVGIPCVRDIIGTRSMRGEHHHSHRNQIRGIPGSRHHRSRCGRDDKSPIPN